MSSRYSSKSFPSGKYRASRGYRGQCQLAMTGKVLGKVYIYVENRKAYSTVNRSIGHEHHRQMGSPVMIRRTHFARLATLARSKVGQLGPRTGPSLVPVGIPWSFLRLSVGMGTSHERRHKPSGLSSHIVSPQATSLSCSSFSSTPLTALPSRFSFTSLLASAIAEDREGILILLARHHHL